MKRVSGYYATKRRLDRLDSLVERRVRAATRFVPQSHALGRAGDPRPMVLIGLSVVALVAALIRWRQ